MISHNRIYAFGVKSLDHLLKMPLLYAMLTPLRAENSHISQVAFESPITRMHYSSLQETLL